MKRLINLLIAVLLISATNILAQDPPPPPPTAKEKLFFKGILKDEAQYLKELSAKMKMNLEKIKEYNEQKYLELLSEARFSKYGNFFKGVSLEHNETIMELEIESQALAMEYKAGKGNKDQIKKDLQVTLEMLLDFKEERRQKELKALEAKISELKKSIKARKKNKKEIIRRRMMDMLGESDYYDWE